MRLFLFFLLLSLTACEVKITTPSSDKQEGATRNRSKIRNGIDIQTSGGVNVEQAFLTYEDDGSFVSDSNVTTLNRPVKMNLVVKGWTPKEGLVFIDAAQKVTTSDGDLVLNKTGMLDELGGIKPEDAKYLSFQFVIRRVVKIFDYFLVEVVAKNKNADQELKASFKVHVE